MLKTIQDKLRNVFRKNTVWADWIIGLFKLSFKNIICYWTNGEIIQLGMKENLLLDMLDEECILRRDQSPIEGIDLIASLNGHPCLYRYVFAKGKLISLIIEIGINLRNIKKIYEKLEIGLVENFKDSLEKSNYICTGYNSFSWQCDRHYCFLTVLNDTHLHLSPFLLDFLFRGFEIEGTFLIKPGTNYEILPTLAYIISDSKKSRVSSLEYLLVDLPKRTAMCDSFTF